MIDKSPKNSHSPTGLVRSDEPLARTEFNSPRASGRALVSSPAYGLATSRNCAVFLSIIVWQKKQGIISAFLKRQGITKKEQGATPCKNGLGRTLHHEHVSLRDDCMLKPELWSYAGCKHKAYGLVTSRNCAVFFIYYCLAKKAAHHFSFFKKAGHHQKGAGRHALQKRLR